MGKFVCIHGHFYQPPRENPWLEEIELQESARPYHDWNKRITAECYRPNTAARILDKQGRIIDIINNYSRMSFNFGPTLLSWMERNDPETYRAVIQSDIESRDRFSGHGSAMAQCYNHMIMPLAAPEDKETQIIWGIKDFVYRYGRRPEGMWLPETAVDLATLDLLAKEEIKFSVLAPHQAKAVRRLEGGDWLDTSGSRVDPRQPYMCRLPSGRTITVFFYDGPVSRAVAFEHLLDDSQHFKGRLLGLFDANMPNQLVHIATDGETYGHHHSRGDMALAAVLDDFERYGDVTLTNYSEFLANHPPAFEVQIFENSSWSCSHGIERWRNNCGCNSGGHPGWHQNWRRPLREAMDWLREKLKVFYENEAKRYLRQPREARNAYIDVLLNRSKGNIDRFLKQHGVNSLNDEDKVKTLMLCEIQRFAMLMYTSCGWFFDEVSGLENIQVLRYAARAIQLAQDLGLKDLEKNFLEYLRKVPSNIVEYHHAANIYEKFVRPSVTSLERVGAHYAVSSLFEEYPQKVRLYSYSADSQNFGRVDRDRRRLAVGRTRIRSEVTWEEIEVEFAVQHWGDQRINGGIRLAKGERAFLKMKNAALKVFRDVEPLRFQRFLQKNFRDSHYSLAHLFKDEQIKILYQILDASLGEVESCLRQITEHHESIIRVVHQLKVPLPRMLANTVSVMLDTDIIRAIANDPVDFERLEILLKEAQECRMEIDRGTLGFVVRRRINNLMQGFLRRPRDIHYLLVVLKLLETLEPFSLDFEFWTAQNIYFYVGTRLYGIMKKRSLRGHSASRAWVSYFERLGKFFNVNLPV